MGNLLIKVFAGGSRCYTGQFFQKEPPLAAGGIKNLVDKIVSI